MTIGHGKRRHADDAKYRKITKNKTKKRKKSNNKRQKETRARAFDLLANGTEARVYIISLAIKPYDIISEEKRAAAAITCDDRKGVVGARETRGRQWPAEKGRVREKN